MSNRVIVSKAKLDNLVDILNNKLNTSGLKDLNDIATIINDLKMDNGQLTINQNVDLTIVEYIFANTDINSIKFNGVTVNKDTYKTEIPEEQATEDCFSWNGTTITGLTEIGVTWLSEHNGAIALPDKCTSITGGFKGRTDLLTIYIPMTVRVIGNSTFEGCNKLIAVKFYGELDTLGNRAFYNCTSLTTVQMPSTIVNFGENVFNNCTNLINVEFKEGLSTIGTNAFYNCTKLTSVTIPNSVTSIGDWAFANCRSLTSVIIGNGVTSIGTNAFYNCTSLTNIILPDSVTTIGSGAFYSCAFTDINLPANLTTIEKQAFKSCNNLISVNTNNCTQLKTLGYEIFYDCKALTEFIMPNTVESIGYGIFRGCSQLNNVTLSENPKLTTLPGYPDNGEAGVFANCTNLKSVQIPNNITQLDRGAFYYCTSLSNIELPDSITNFTVGVFRGCSSLTNITLPANLTTIGNACFRDCTKLVNIDTSKCTQLKTIGLDFCMNATALESIELPDSIESIDSTAFNNCTSLTSVKLPNNEKYTELVCADGYGMFANCKLLTSITIPSYIKIIGLSCFSGCTSLESVVFEENSQLTTLKQKAFINCTSLSSIELPDSVETIGNQAFYQCTSLTNITLPANLITIGDSCFRLNSALTNIDTRKSNKITTINSYAFAQCTSLKNFDMPNSVETTGAALFFLDSSLTSTHISTNEKVTKLASVAKSTNNGEGWFTGCSSLVSITIPTNIIDIDICCFKDCTSLKSIYLPNSITTIGLRCVFNTPSDLTIYYNGNEEEFNAINIGTNNTDLAAKTKVYNHSTTWNSDIYKVEGYCGPSVKYRIQLNESKLYISGSGATGNYLDEITTNPSFNSYKNDITSIFFVNKHISKIGKNTFNDLTNVTDIYFVGTEEEFNNIVIETGNDIIISATKHYETVL